ncbi:MAG TPA: biotin/lipoyl-containing protein, partial [Chitinophagaceae bacterium]|nr:biotin/lipoyl-containing protein [Chitinophagaceae bacterium]
MAEVILMPRLSDTMTEGVIAAWHKKVGDTVKKGELLAEVETDKATMELESYKDGTLLHIGVDNGGKLQVNDLLAIIGKPGEDISGLIKSSGNKEAKQPEKKDEGTKEKKQETNDKVQGTRNKEQETKNQEPVTNNKIDISKMEEVVLMPRLSDTMTEGVIASWNKNIGDDVKKGELLAEIETDKATMELESYKNGKLLYIGAQKGEKIAVNDLLCIIGEEGKVDVNKIVAAAKGGVKPEAGSQKPDVKPVEAVATQPATNIQQAPLAGISADKAATTDGQPANNGRVKASPLAKKLAAEKGIDLNKIHGSGDGGRIIKADIDSSVPSAKAAIPTFTPVAGEEGYTDISNSQIRSVIAKRLVESKFSAPHFYLTMEINMDNAISARVQLNEVSPVKISFNDLVVKAAALALRQHPAVNASWLGDKIRRYHH